MRTTIDISSAHRAQLLDLAARRGEKGFSAIVREALDAYFQKESDRRERVQRALSAVGSFSDEEAERLEAEVCALRQTWR